VLEQYEAKITKQQQSLYEFKNFFILTKQNFNGANF